MTTIILQRFANREYRLTHQNVFGGQRNRGDKYAEKQAEKYAIAVRDTYVLQQELQQGEAALISDWGLERRSFGEVDARSGLHALDIINEFQTSKCDRKKGGWGCLSKPTKFTKNARHKLLEAGAVVDAKCGLNAWEVTCTIAGSGRKIFAIVAAHTGWIMNELTQILRRSKCEYWFYVWEYQKRGALHLHLLIADNTRCLLDLAKRVESRWWELQKLLSVRTEVDLFQKNHQITWKDKPDKWQSHVAPIKKSVAAYFSKYAGKGSGITSKFKGFETAFTPSRWWGSSKAVKKLSMEMRARWKYEISPSCAKEVRLFLKTFLESHPRVKNYGYEFQLGQTANGTELGAGEVWISYYDDLNFKRMQTWEEYYLLGVDDILRRHGYADMDTQTWTNADFACKHPLDADMEKRRHDAGSQNIKSRTSSPSPPNQQSSISRKLSKSRGTQAEPTLELRARLVQFLAGGGGEVFSSTLDDTPLPKYYQGNLFNKNY